MKKKIKNTSKKRTYKDKIIKIINNLIKIITHPYILVLLVLLCIYFIYQYFFNIKKSIQIGGISQPKELFKSTGCGNSNLNKSLLQYIHGEEKNTKNIKEIKTKGNEIYKGILDINKKYESLPNDHPLKKALNKTGSDLNRHLDDLGHSVSEELLLKRFRQDRATVLNNFENEYGKTKESDSTKEYKTKLPATNVTIINKQK